jgi:broad specificity phosphatase PhoE
MRLFIIRHGETEHNKNRIFQGQFNSFLSDTGFEQARLLAKRFKDYKLVNVYSSDLSRAKDTALEVLKFHKNSNLVLDKRIRERSFGELENNPIPADFNWANPPGFV